MELNKLGLDSQLQQQASALCESGLRLARVTAVDRGRYVVCNEAGEVSAELTGKFLHTAASSVDMPCVGVQYHDVASHASIHELVPRRSFLRRKSPGKNIDFQMIAANIDVAFIVQSCQFDFNVRRLERYLVMVNEGHITPVLLLTKTDLVSEAELRALSRRLADINPRARQAQVHFGQTDIAGILDIRGFNLNAILEIEPEFLSDVSHEHDDDVSS